MSTLNKVYFKVNSVQNNTVVLGIYDSLETPTLTLTSETKDGTKSASTVNLPSYQGATSSTNGTSGLVPSSSSSDRDKFLKGDGTWAEVNTEKEVGYSTTEPTAQSTATLDNESFVFYETESFGGDGAWNASISGNAATADSVNHTMTLTVDGGTLEGLTKYSFNGSVAKEVNLAAGNGVTLTPTYGTVTISTETYPAYQGATENANGVEGLVPAATSAERDKYLKGDGTWEQVLSGIQNISVQEINVAKGKNAHLVDPTEWMYYNDYSTIDADVQFLDAENQLVAKTFNANSDGITFAFPEGSEPKTLSGKVELCKGNCDYWDEIAFDGISIEDLLAAGENGIFIQDAFTKNETVSAYPYQDDTNAIVYMIDNGNGSYTLKLATCETEEVAEPSLQLEKADGTTESVNMDALYGHIGGNVQVEVNTSTVSNVEYLPLTNYFPFNSSDNVEPPSEYPAYSIAYMMDNNSAAFLNESGETTRPSNSSINGNYAVLEFRMVRDLVYSNGLPKTIRPIVYRLTGNYTDAIADIMTTFAIGVTEDNPLSISIDDALTATNGIELHEYALGSNDSNTPTPTGGDPIYLFVEKISDDPYTLRLKLAKQETSTETTLDPVLHLEKSESSSIDLSPIYEHIGGSIQSKNVVSDIEYINLYSYSEEDEEEEPDFPLYDVSQMASSDGSPKAFLTESGEAVTPSNFGIDGNIAQFQFDVAPESIAPFVECGLNNGNTPDSFSYFLIGLNADQPAYISINDALAATNGIELKEYILGSNGPVLSGRDPIYLLVEKTSDDPYTLKMKLARQTVEAKQVLHMEKSASNDIDLSPLTAKLLTTGTLECQLEEPQKHTTGGGINISTFDENNNLISNQQVYPENGVVSITLPANVDHVVVRDYYEFISNTTMNEYNINHIISHDNLVAGYTFSSSESYETGIPH